MAFFGRKNKEEKPPKSTIEKIVMGAIIGTAVGSVVGRSMAKKSGKETRDYLKDQYKKQINSHQDDLEEITKLTKETVTGIGTLLKNLVFGKNRQSKADPKKSSLRPHQDLKKIPREEVAESSTRD